MTKSDIALLKNESVAIIGGGIAGCLLAIELKLMGYGNVTIFEAKEDLCLTASKVVSELHSGAEYPFDIQSGRDCLNGLIAFKKLFPSSIFRKPRTQFLLSRDSVIEGLTSELFSDYCKQLTFEYQNILEKDPSSINILGDPKDFWKEISADRFSDVKNAVFGYETPQHGIEPLLLVKHIKQLVEEHNIKLQMSQTVEAIEPFGRKFKLVCSQPDKLKELTFTQLAFANHFSGLPLMTTICNSDFQIPEIYAALRLIVLAKHNEKSPFPRPTRFMLEGIHGAMDGPISEDQSLVYQPSLSHLGKLKLDKSYTVPADWISRIAKPNRDDIKRSTEILREVSQIAYPYISKSVVEKTYLRIAINTVEESRQRRNPGVSVPLYDCVSVALTTKATCAAINAQSAAKILSEHAFQRD